MSEHDNDLGLSGADDRAAHDALLVWGQSQRDLSGAPPPGLLKLGSPVADLRLARDGEPVTVRRRRRRTSGVAMLAVAASVVAVGAVAVLPARLLSTAHRNPRVAASSQPPVGPRDVQFVQAVRTSPDGRSLVVNYVGGECDGTPRLTADEDRQSVSLRLVVPRDGQQFCYDVGISRTISVDLDEPLGRRRLTSGGRVLQPFDGARLLTPPSVPAGYTLRRESGSSPAEFGQDQTTLFWEQMFAEPERPPTTSGACGPGQAPLRLVQGPIRQQYVSRKQWKQIGTTAVAGAVARVLEGTYFTGMPLGLALTWDAAGGSVTLTSQPGCGGDTIASQSELEQIARSLRPARTAQAPPPA